MSIRDFRDLRCWQLAQQMRREVCAICAKPAAAQDERFCNGFRAASGSVCRNLAEGFGRYESVYIVQFTGYALASLQEVQDYLEECVLRGLIDRELHDRLWELSEHTKAASLKFQRSHRERIAAGRLRK